MAGKVIFARKYRGWWESGKRLSANRPTRHDAQLAVAGEDSMIYVDIDKPMNQRAKRASEDNYAILGSKGTLLVGKERKIRHCGYVAEEMVAQTFPRLVKVEKRDYDFEYRDFTFEVKGIGCNQEPEPHWEATSMAYQEDRKFTHFIFCRVNNNVMEGWILGFISREDFYEQARFAEKGTKNQNFEYDNDRHCIEIRLLSDPDKMDDLLDASDKSAQAPCVNCGHWNGYMPGQVPLCGRCWLVGWREREKIWNSAVSAMRK